MPSARSALAAMGLLAAGAAGSAEAQTLQTVPPPAISACIGKTSVRTLTVVSEQPEGARLLSLCQELLTINPEFRDFLFSPVRIRMLIEAAQGGFLDVLDSVEYRTEVIRKQIASMNGPPLDNRGDREIAILQQFVDILDNL